MIKKEQVTIYEIKKDLMRYINREVMGILVGIPLIWFVLKISSMVIIKILSTSALFFNFLMILLILCAFWSFIKILIKYNDIKKEKFILRNDTLLDKQDYEPGVTKWHAYKPYRLTFSYDYFDIPAQLNYNWSTSHSMDEKEIYITASIGDTFTLVEFNKKILVVYNNKFFDIVSAKL